MPALTTRGARVAQSGDAERLPRGEQVGEETEGHRGDGLGGHPQNRAYALRPAPEAEGDDVEPRGVHRGVGRRQRGGREHEQGQGDRHGGRPSPEGSLR